MTTTASEWLDTHPSDVMALTSMLQDMDMDIGVWLELPEKMKRDIMSQLAETFSQPYWDDISRVTAGHAEKFLEQGLTEGWSIRRIASTMATEFLGDTYKHALMRATRIARTEAGHALNAARTISINGMRSDLPVQVEKYIKRSWLSILSGTTRDAHADLDGVPEDEDGMWNLNGVRIPWPGHTSLPARDRCNCFCTVVIEWGIRESTAQQLIDEHVQRAEAREVGDDDLANQIGT